MARSASEPMQPTSVHLATAQSPSRKGPSSHQDCRTNARAIFLLFAPVLPCAVRGSLVVKFSYSCEDDGFYY